MNLTEEIAEAEARVVALKQRAQAATCAELGHDWHSLGGCNCGCHDEACCSVPVNECRRCGECDYGKNADAAETVRECKLYHPERHEPALQLQDFPRQDK